MKYNKQYISALIMISLITPSMVFAAGTSTMSTPNFCSTLTTFTADAETKKGVQLKDKFAKLDKRQAELLLKRTENDRTLTGLETEASEKQNLTYTKLLSQAKTDTEKAAVNQFIAGAKKAFTARQAALTTARNTYRTAFDQRISARKVMLEAALATEKTSIDRAVTTAKSDCARGVSSTAVRATYKNAITKAHDTFKLSVKGLGNLNDSVATLTQNRKTSIATAESTFKKEMENLKITLKTQLGKK